MRYCIILLNLNPPKCIYYKFTVHHNEWQEAPTKFMPQQTDDDFHSGCQNIGPAMSPQALLLRTTLTRTIIIYQLKTVCGREFFS